MERLGALGCAADGAPTLLSTSGRPPGGGPPHSLGNRCRTSSPAHDGLLLSSHIKLSQKPEDRAREVLQRFLRDAGALRPSRENCSAWRTLGATGGAVAGIRLK